MENLKVALIEQKERKGNGCACYGINASDIRNNSKKETIDLRDADYFIRLIVKTSTGHMMHSIAGSKKEYFAVKNGEIYRCDFFAPDGRYLQKGQWSWDIEDNEAEKPMIEKFEKYNSACEKYHNENPTDSRVEYDCFCWFKGTNAVIVAPNWRELKGKFPSKSKKIIRNYNEILK